MGYKRHFQLKDLALSRFFGSKKVTNEKDNL